MAILKKDSLAKQIAILKKDLLANEKIIAEDNNITGTLTVTDADGSVTFAVTTAATNGTASIDSNGQLVNEKIQTDSNIYNIMDNFSLFYRKEMGVPLSHIQSNTNLSSSELITDSQNAYEEFIKGIRKIVNENMSQAIKLHVTEMGEDPRDNVLYAFGGAGPLHAYDLCEKLGINYCIEAKY